MASPIVSTRIGYYTQMLETVNSSAGYVSPSYSNSYVTDGRYCPPFMQYGFMPYTNSQPSMQQSILYHTSPMDAMVSLSFQQQGSQHNESFEPSNANMSQSMYHNPSELYDMSQSRYCCTMECWTIRPFSLCKC